MKKKHFTDLIPQGYDMTYLPELRHVGGAKVYALTKRPDFFKDEFIDPNLKICFDKDLSEMLSKHFGICTGAGTIPSMGVGVFCTPTKLFGVWGVDTIAKNRISRFWDKYEYSISAMIDEAQSIEEIIHVSTLILNGFVAESKCELQSNAS